MNDAAESLFCPACGASDSVMHEFPFPLFRHLDFVRVESGPGNLGECRACGTIYRYAQSEVLDEIDALYRSDLYAAHEEVHAISVPGRPDAVPAPRVQAEVLAGYLPDTPPRILDFGCFNGRLLEEFSTLRSDAELIGYDVAPRAGFPTDSAFRFHCGDWRNIDGPFDLITLSHSIQYVREIAELLHWIRDNLSRGGVLFVQTPDISKKPCALLLGDLHYHFTEDSLASLMSAHGFVVEIFRDLPFPRDVTLLCRAGDSACRDVTGPCGGSVLEQATQHVEILSEAIAAHSEGPAAGILGTTIEAAFVDERLGGKACLFVDENAERVGQTFRGRLTVHPRDVAAGTNVLVPLGSQAVSVAERLSAKYPANFVAL